MQSRQKTIFETVVDILYEFGEKETIEKLGGKWNPVKSNILGGVAREEYDKHWKAKSTRREGENPTIETDTGETVRAKPFGVFPDGGQWEQEFAGLPLDAADGTYTNKGEENRAKFKQIVQQPLPPMEYTSTTVSENKFSTQSRLDIIFETVNQILSEGKGDRRGAGRKRNLKKARQRIKSDMKGLARVENEVSDLEGVQDRFWTAEREGRLMDLDKPYDTLQDRIATAKRRIERRS